VAGIAEVVALLVRHANGAFPQELTENWVGRLTQVRDRWGMQLQS